MTNQLPADIAEAISEFGREATAFGAEEMVAFGDQQALATARAALDAVILKQLTAGYDLRDAACNVLGSCDSPHALDHALGGLERAVRAMATAPTDLGRSALADEGSGT